MVAWEPYVGAAIFFIAAYGLSTAPLFPLLAMTSGGDRQARLVVALLLAVTIFMLIARLMQPAAVYIPA